MPLSAEILLLICAAFFLVSMLYASVGFGGGSSYLAILSLCLSSFYEVRSLALLCNLLVVSGSTYLFWENGYLQFRDCLPFVVLSVPMAFLGANFRLEEGIFFVILGCTLVLAALALFWQTVERKTEFIREFPPEWAYILGGGIGFLSGLVGIGGGIFLAPILHHLKYDKAVKIAAIASFFILVNSVSGLCGLLYQGTFEVSLTLVFTATFSVFLGGQIGLRTSLQYFSPNTIKRVTAVLVLLVGIRILMT